MLRFDTRSTGTARGFIVVAVLWILAALSALVLIYLTFVTNTAVVVAASTERVQIRRAGDRRRRACRLPVDRGQAKTPARAAERSMPGWARRGFR